MLIISVTALTVTGCCNVRKNKVVPVIKPIVKRDNTTTNNGSSTVPLTKQYYAGKKLTQKQIKLSKIYKELEEAQTMLENKNAEGALRAVERIQNSVTDNPYLEMQAWYLSVEIYDKLGKTSRRKRAMRKMMDSIEIMQKNPSYRNSYKDGMISKDLINRVMEKEKGKYDF